MSRRHDLRRLHAHSTYSAKELAEVLQVNISTIRGGWRPRGLEPIDGSIPHLFLGEHVKAFLAARAVPRQPCGPGRLYCVACRSPQVPEGNVVVLEPMAETTVNFIGVCPVSRHRMRRRVRIANISRDLGHCRIAREDEVITISGSGASPQTRLSEELTA